MHTRACTHARTHTENKNKKTEKNMKRPCIKQNALRAAIKFWSKTTLHFREII